MGNIIDVKHLVKVYDKKSVLKDVSLSIKNKEIFGLLGPSGAGKTTIIKILTAQLLYEKGYVKVFQQPVLEMKRNENRKKMGIMSDNSGLYVRLSIEENLLLYSKLYDVPKSAIEEALRFVGLYEDRKKRVSKLSRGMFQRVVLARAILHKPDLLFLDEPTSSLDPASTDHIHRGLRRLNEEGTTIFLTTHDMLEAESLCDRVAFLHEGEIRALGKPSELKEQFSDQTITIELQNGEKEIIQNDENDAEKVYNIMKSGQLKKIYTNEPNLGEIFVKLTGSELT